MERKCHFELSTITLRWLVFGSLLVAGYALLTAGCGWRLRGSYEFPPSMARLYVEGTARFSELGNAIHNAFDGTNTRLVESVEDATAILKILADASDRRILATDSSGRASEYEITHVVRFKLINDQGETLVPDQEVRARREYRFDPANVLATGGEVDRLQEDMLRDSVQQMLRRIHLTLRSSRPNG